MVTQFYEVKRIGQMSQFQSLNLRRDHLREQIANSIQNMIATRKLQPGDQLPSERELAKQLGVNRATLRESIRLLEQRGLVQMRVGSGTYIADLSRAVLSDSIERYFVFGSCSHEDLVVVREIIEPEMAALAAQHADTEDLAKLRDLLERLEVAFAHDDVAAYAAADTAFHEMLAVATHNELLTAIISGLEKPMRSWLQAQSASYRLEAGARSHRLVYDAVAAHEPERARAAMKMHMGTTRATLRQEKGISGATTEGQQ